MSKPVEPCEIRIREYRLGKKLGSGSFGQLYSGHHIVTNELVAIKLESIDAKHPQVAWEYRIYKAMEAVDYFPRIYWYGVVGDFIALIMAHLGHSLEHISRNHPEFMSHDAVCEVGRQMIDRIRALHSKGYIHRDIKPDNFIMGRNSFDCNTVYCIDYGLAKKYLQKDGSHIPHTRTKSLTGTARYASIEAHAGSEQSRRDDLESILYVMIYLCKGVLPWQENVTTMKEPKAERYQKIMQKKIQLNIADLCSGCPPAFAELLQYVRDLHFDDTPDYTFMMNTLARPKPVKLGSVFKVSAVKVPTVKQKKQA